MKNPINRKTFLLFAVLASLAISVQAQNLVQNPGFETGNFTSWVNAGDTFFDGVSTAFPHSGQFAANLGSNTFSTLSQVIPTTPGQFYDISFWVRLDAGATPNNSFTAAFAGVTGVTIAANSPSFAYTQFSFTNVLAPTATSLLVFTDHNAPGFWYVDDVSVTAAVPEPSTAALLGVMAAGALGLRVWRKRKAA